MSLRELTEKARATDQATAKAQAVEEMFKKNTAADAFVKMIDAMPEEDQKAFAEVLRNPSIARKLVNGSPSPSQRPAAETTDFDEFTREEAPKAQPQPQNEEFRTLQRGMKVLLEAHQARMQQEQHQTMAQQVEASMNGFPVFSETPSGSKYARQAIMQTIAQNPGAKVDDVVASHAAQLHGLLQEQRQAAMPARNGEMRTSRQYQLPNLEREPTWKDLGSSGGLSAIGRALLERS
jgi:hypothetical protein